MNWKHGQAAACVALVVWSAVTPAAIQMAAAQQVAQQVSSNAAPVSATLPAAPNPTQPLYLRPTEHDYGKGRSGFPNPLSWYQRTDYPEPRLTNTPRLDDLLRDGKIYLSLSDAVTLAVENNFDIAIARINLDIADADLLRAKAGASLRGVSTGLVANTIGGSSTTITGGGGPGGTTSAAGGSGTGNGGLVLSTNGAGPVPEVLDPALTGTVEYQSQKQAQATPLFSGGLPSIYNNTGTFNFAYNQGFLTGTQLQVGFNNTRVTTNNPNSAYTPQLNTSLVAQVTQHLLQGFGTGINGRFILQAKNTRRITDSAFRQQVLYTVNQVENIYWALVSAYEDEQAKERALAQSTQLTADNRRQVQIGTLAPLDVVNSDASVASDKQALVASQTNLEYQQLLMKQAIARNLNDAALSAAPVIPTDRVSLERLPVEDETVDDLVKLAYANNPQIEQAVLNMKNNQITIKAERNGLLPVVDAFGFYGGSGLGGTVSPACAQEVQLYGFPVSACPSNSGYGSVLNSTFNNTNQNYAVGVNINIPLRNRVAQADQARSQMELRQSEMRLQQLYTQIRMNVINGQFALTNDRAQVNASQASRDYAAQSLDAEQKKYHLGASTTALVLQQQRNLALAENTLISAQAVYAKDRAALRQLLASTLDDYGITITDAATGSVSKAPAIPGLTKPEAPAAPKPIPAVAPPAPGN